MKKKLILSVICTVLLSFGAMAKSNVASKPVFNKKQVSIVQKKPIQKNRVCDCVSVITSCGARGIACGSFTEMIRDAMSAERAFC